MWQHGNKHIALHDKYTGLNLLLWQVFSGTDFLKKLLAAVEAVITYLLQFIPEIRTV